MLTEKIKTHRVIQPSKFLAPVFLAGLFVCGTAFADSSPAFSSSVSPAVVQVLDQVRTENRTGTMLPSSDDQNPETGLIRSRIWPEALVPTTAVDQIARADLLALLARLETKNDPLWAEPITEYLNLHSDSPWKLGLLGNRGLALIEAGRLSEALQTLETAWYAGKTSTLPPARRLADRVMAERLHLLAQLGRVEETKTLLAELADRPLTGTAAEIGRTAERILASIEDSPETLLRCGPLALQALLDPLSPADWGPDDRNRAQETVAMARAGARGFSLAQLEHLAHQAGLPLVAAKQDPGTTSPAETSIPVPSVVHWKVGHYVAILSEDNGRYLIHDAVQQRDYRLSAEDILREGSGYFLVPDALLEASAEPASAQPGTTHSLKVADADEAGRIRGGSYAYKADDRYTGSEDPADGGDGPVCGGMPTYQITSAVVGLNIQDRPLGYVPPVGPAVSFRLSYNQREESQPANFTVSNVGPNWTHDWLTWIEDDPTKPGQSVQRYVSGGGTRTYSGFDSKTGGFKPETDDGTVLIRYSADPIIYARLFNDGRIEVYSASDGQTTDPRRIYLSHIADAAQNLLNFEYDNQMRLIAVRDALGQKTTVHYGHSDPLLITAVRDPFGREARLGYDSYGRLASITDVAGMTSTFAYEGETTFIEAMSTPYGTTRFVSGESNPGRNGFTRWLEATDPLGHTERLELMQNVLNVSELGSSKIPQGMPHVTTSYYNHRDTFYWNKTNHAQNPGVYGQALIRHWMHGKSDRSDAGQLAGHLLEWVKTPLNDRVWLNYPGQSSSYYQSGITLDLPSLIGRVLPDNKTELTQYSYNALGRVTKATDPAGRETVYAYDANGIDLTEVKQKNGSGYDVLMRATWNELHKPLTVTDAAGQTTRYAYNARGQLTQATNALNETTRYEYDGSGYLIRIIDAGGRVQATYGYDNYGRVASVTDSEGYTVNYQYDALDRIVRTGYPDGTSETVTWDRLKPVQVRDRQGRVTRYEYDALRRLVSQTDPLNRTVRYGYDADGRLIRLTDAEGKVTQWQYDIAGRLIAKIYPDGRSETQTWDSAGRLIRTTDAAGQHRDLSYTVDGQLSAIAYPNAALPTPWVTYQYDPSYARITGMTDGSGTTQWSYLPVGVLGAGQVFNETTAYGTTTNTYDALGRPITRKVGNAEEKWTYDELGRIKRHQNPLGAFDYGYLGRTGQVTSEQLAGGAFGTSYRYQGNDQDRRLKAITPTAARTLQSGGSAFFYRFDVNGQLTAQTRILGPDWAWSERYSLDGADRLTGYQIDLRLNGGLIDPMALAGILAEQPDPVGWLDPIAPFYQGTGTFSMTTSDSVIGATPPPGSLAASWSGQVDNRNQLTRVNATAIQSDANGNITDDGEKYYYWDAEQRLYGILDKKTNRGTVFLYDGLGRRVREYDADLTRGTLDLAQKADYAWCGSKVCQTRDAWGTTIEMPQGLIRQGSPIAYYFHRDHLGSVVDVSQADGNHLARTMYSPYGQKELLSSDAAYVEYAGMRLHEPSGLYLTYYRAYDPKLGRWLSRDPIGEAGGLNLYGYVGCRPGSYTDPWGLADKSLCEAMREVLKEDPRFVNGTWFNPLEVGSEYIPSGGHGVNNAHFTHSNGLDYDIQYVQVGWSVTTTYNQWVAHGLHASWLFFVAFMNDSNFTSENVSANQRGYQLGINGANSFKSFAYYIDSQCGKCKQ